MPVFASVYRQTKHQESFLLRQQKARKRKLHDDEDENDHDGSDAGQDSIQEGQPPASTVHPVNRTDPYHVAGHPREHPLPPAPFPHAPAPDTRTSSSLPSVEDELATLNPPLYFPSRLRQDDRTTSLKRRHLDNMTAILHKCLLKGDWQRANRAWSLLLKTEIAGQGIDIRQHGRWAVGAEILMHAVPTATQGFDFQPFGNTISDDGLQLARQYYERLILQFPHTPRTQRGLTALAVYPALFNIWIFEVQRRARRRGQRQQAVETLSAAGSDESSPDGSDRDVPISMSDRAEIVQAELREALSISRRMDELLLSPPYDSSDILLEMRGMVALWLSDLHGELVDADVSGSEDRISSHSTSGEQSADQHRSAADSERSQARRLFARVKDSGGQLQAQAQDFLESD